MKKKKILTLIVFLVSITSVAFISYNLSPKSSYESKVNKIKRMSLEERQAQVDKIVEEGMMNVKYTSSITVKDNISKDFNIQNIENNKYPIKFRIEDENKQVIYESNLIDLGYELNGLEFNNELPKGSHSFRIFIGYDKEGNVESSFPLNVEVS